MATYISALQLARVVRILDDEGITATDPLFTVRFRTALASVLGGDAAGGRTDLINIDLPDIERDTGVDIIPDNLKALSALYFAAMLEELKFFAVADKVAEQFTQGMLPMSRGAGAHAVYHYIRRANDRFTEPERRGLYARAFGIAQGSVNEPMPNREFNDLWIRFFSSVSMWNRLQDSAERRIVTPPQVFKNARDLAVNLSLHGYGIAHPAAVELQDDIKNILQMISFPDVLTAYGVRDSWQLVERVSQMYLGGAANSVRQRALAQSGSLVIQWLADKHTALANPYGQFDLANERDLLFHAERWLAVTGTGENAIEKLSQPVSMAAQSTIPSFSLQGAGDLLRDAMGKLGSMNGANPQIPRA
jgi:hypothetical protein